MLYYTTADGHTWTNRTFAAGIVDSGDTPSALTYDEASGLFVLSVAINGGVSVRFCTSTDALTWTVASTLTTGPFFLSDYVSDLACVNGVIVGVTSGSSTVAPNNAAASRVIYSIDSATTWHWGPSALTGGTLATQRPRIHSGGAGLLIHNSAGVRLGLSANTSKQPIT
jgi:hypothetical protein